MLVTNQTTQDYWFGPLHLPGGVGTTLTVDDTTEQSLYLSEDTVADALNNLYASGKITVSGAAQPFPRPTGTPALLHGDGSPEGLVYATQGSLYMRRDGVGLDSLYVKTTGLTLSTGWESFGSAIGGPGTQWDYKQVTANVTGITGTTEATAANVVTGNTVTYDGTQVKIEFFCPGSGGGANGISYVLLCDSTVIGQHIGDQANQNPKGQKVEAFHTPAAGAHTYAVKAYSPGGGSAMVYAGPGGSGNLLPAFMRVTKA